MKKPQGTRRGQPATTDPSPTLPTEQDSYRGPSTEPSPAPAQTARPLPHGTVRLARRPGRNLPSETGRPVYQSRISPPAPPDDWGAVARLYDLEHPACRGAELNFWHGEATAATTASAASRVLELAAGSGRVAIALARKGHHVTGLELSDGMLDRARQRTARLPAAARDRLRWVQGDMSSFAIPDGQFGLIFVAFNSFWLLHSVELQLRALRSMADHLAPGGAVVLDLFPPNQDDYADEIGIAQPLPARWHGHPILRIKDYTYDTTLDLAISDVRYYATDPAKSGANRLMASFRYTLRIAEPESVIALLSDAGFTVHATYGTYTREPLDAGTPRAIFVARRKT